MPKKHKAQRGLLLLGNGERMVLEEKKGEGVEEEEEADEHERKNTSRRAYSPR